MPLWSPRCTPDNSFHDLLLCDSRAATASTRWSRADTRSTPSSTTTSATPRTTIPGGASRRGSPARRPTATWRTRWRRSHAGHPRPCPPCLLSYPSLPLPPSRSPSHSPRPWARVPSSDPRAAGLPRPPSSPPTRPVSTAPSTGHPAAWVRAPRRPSLDSPPLFEARLLLQRGPKQKKISKCESGTFCFILAIFFYFPPFVCLFFNSKQISLWNSDIGIPKHTWQTLSIKAFFSFLLYLCPGVCVLLKKIKGRFFWLFVFLMMLFYHNCGPCGWQMLQRHSLKLTDTCTENRHIRERGGRTV